eukprot:FR737637.1.p1 GENE.FR737637.1~~FR737637.1.p1  ORF type:complete len:226 (+),score=34.92 FR737637.1:1-678(+)
MGDEDGEYKVSYYDAETKELAEPVVWVEKEGKAKVEYISGDTYDGDFNQEKMEHGQGTYVWTKKNEDDEIVLKATYTGSYVDGKRCGVGTMTFPNGDVYQGEWKDNKMNGQGLYRFKRTGDVFDGIFVDGLKEGKGTYEYGEDRSKLSGNWSKGTIVDGDWILEGSGVYSGSFGNGKPSGEGKYDFKSGIKQTGAYVAPPIDEDDEEAPVGDPSWVGTPVFKSVV